MPEQQLDIVVRMKDFATQGFKLLDGTVKKFSSSATTAIKYAAGAATALAVTSGAAFAALLKSTADEADHLGDLSRQLGVSVESLGALQFAARQSGVSMEELEVALKTLNKDLGELQRTGGGAGADAFNELSAGLRQMVRDGAPTEEIFTQIVRELKNLDVAQRSLVSSELFGKGGSRLLRLATEDVDGLVRRFRELGGVINQDLVLKGDAFNDALGELRVAAGSAGKELAHVLLPEVTKLVKAFTDGLVAHQPEVLEFFATLTEGAGLAGGAIIELLGPLLNLRRDFASITYEDAGNKVLKLRDSIKELKREIESPTPGAFDVSPAVRAALPAELENKRRQLQAAEEAFDRARKDFEQLDSRAINVNGAEFVASMNRAAQAMREQATAVKDLQTFMGPLQESDQKRLESIQQQAKGTDDLFKAQEKVTAEAKRSADAARKLGKEIEEYAEKTEAFSGLQAHFRKLRQEAEETGVAVVRAAKAIEDSIADHVTEGLIAMINGTKSAKEAFREMAISILLDIQKIIVKEMVLFVVKSLVGGVGGFFTGAAKGGTFGGHFEPVSGHMAAAGVVRSRGLFELREAGQNEAVVPLPDNRSIPVKFTGGGAARGGDNVTNINVTYVSKALSTAEERQQLERNGKLIADIVVQRTNQSMRTRDGLAA